MLILAQASHAQRVHCDRAEICRYVSALSRYTIRFRRYRFGVRALPNSKYAVTKTRMSHDSWSHRATDAARLREALR